MRMSSFTTAIRRNSRDKQTGMIAKNSIQNYPSLKAIYVLRRPTNASKFVSNLFL